jgi:predicted acetyltransferase
MLSNCLLIRPAAPFRESYRDALREGFHSNGGSVADAEKIARIEEDFAAHLETLDRDGQTPVQVRGVNLPSVPSNMFWLVENDEFIGAASIRARIDTRLLAHFAAISAIPSVRHGRDAAMEHSCSRWRFGFVVAWG